MNISLKEFKRGYKAFQKHEQRDAIYTTAEFLVSRYRNNPAKMADSIGVLLLTWNQAFYRYGLFDFNKLEKAIHRNAKYIKQYRKRKITSLNYKDEKIIKKLFNDFLKALQISEKGAAGNKSPVAVAKALHLLAPSYFALWDEKIAKAYQCYYYSYTIPADRYMNFLYKMQAIAKNIKPSDCPKDKTILKLIDEYNYAKYTKGWI